MKYQANPVIVDAFRIAEIAEKNPATNGIPLILEGHDAVEASPTMCCRLPDEKPKVGDYWVVQSDGYVYLNPKDVFERKYSPVAA